MKRGGGGAAREDEEEVVRQGRMMRGWMSREDEEGRRWSGKGG